ncbi:hydrogenase 3 maturation endopeptidase HyCI [bacterium]|nr:hydrogenase 3 maturation endopeptidase HyCI [bacterium]
MIYQELKENLLEILKGKTVVLGIGNVLKGDDAVGSLLIENIRKLPNFLCINGEEVPENYTGDIISEKPDTLLIVDAINIGSEPGDIFILKPEQLQDDCSDAHHVPLKVLILYLKNYIDADIYILGIQPKLISFSEQISEEVSDSISTLEKIFKDISKLKN